MNNFDFFLLTWFSLNAFLVVAQVGRRREPIEPLVAAFAVVIYIALSAGLLFSRGVF